MGLSKIVGFLIIAIGFLIYLFKNLMHKYALLFITEDSYNLYLRFLVPTIGINLILVGILILSFKPLVLILKKKKFKEFNYFILFILVFVAAIFLLNILLKIDVFVHSHTDNYGRVLLFPLSLERDLFLMASELFTHNDVDENLIDIPIYKLYVTGNNLDRLNENLPESGRQNVNGNMSFEGKLYKTNLRYRGDNYYHWGEQKKSYRSKLKNKKLINGTNKFNFINPKTPHHLLPLILNFNKALDLINPDIEHVALYVNNRYYGVYYKYEQIDETLLRNRDLLPGDLYSGDAARDDKTEGKYYSKYNLFEGLDGWEIVATHDNDLERARKNLAFFIDNIKNSDNKEFYNFFNRYLGNMYLKFLAQKSLIYDVHTDNTHNNKFYFNPATGIFEPIPWDQDFFKNEQETFDVAVIQIDIRLLEFPDLIDKKNKYVYELLEKVPLEDLQNAIDDDKLEYEMSKDFLKDVMFPPISRKISYSEWKKSLGELKDVFAHNYEMAKRILEKNDVRVYRNQNCLQFATNSTSGILIKKTISKNNETIVNGTVYSSRKIIETKGAPYNRKKVEKIIKVPGVYTYCFDSDISKFDKVILENTVTKEEFEILSSEFLEKPDLLDDNGYKKLEKTKETIILEGNLIINDSIIINELSTLIIKPGTNIRMSENASIIVYGQLIVNGTSENKVKITAKDKNWGVVALQGKNSQGYLNNCIIEKGTQATESLVGYSGMVSAYGAKGITMNNCILQDNMVGDDIFNAKLTKVSMSNVTIKRAFGDAIDIDISKGHIDGIIVRDAKNDGIDLMTSNISITNSVIENSGDKGISVGERSQPIIFKNIIAGNTHGLASKDGSNPILINNSFILNDIAIAAYQKNWRYDSSGYGVLLEGNEFRENRMVWELNKSSEFVIYQGSDKKLCNKNNVEEFCNDLQK